MKGIYSTGAWHPEAVQLYRSLSCYVDGSTAGAVAFGLELAPNASPDQRAAWVRRVIAELEGRFDAETIKNVRLGCYCDETENPGKCTAGGYPCADRALFDKVRDWLRGQYLESSGLEDFADRANSGNLGWYVRGGELYTKFFECECPMLEAVGELPTFTWCYCTAGYGKRLFEGVFGCPVEVEILHSIRQGHDYCLMKVSLKGEKT